jgi:hypothetical protein
MVIGMMGGASFIGSAYMKRWVIDTARPLLGSKAYWPRHCADVGSERALQQRTIPPLHEPSRTEPRDVSRMKQATEAADRRIFSASRRQLSRKEVLAACRRRKPRVETQFVPSVKLSAD